MTIYFLNPSPDSQIWGGVQKLHDYAEILAASGLDAAVISVRSFKGHWFESSARLVVPPVRLHPGDLLAFPEVYGDALRSLAPGYPRVSINQNTFQMYRNVTENTSHPYDNNPDLVSVLVVSEVEQALVSRTFPQVDVQRVPLHLNRNMFRFRDGHRPRRIAYMPRKRPDESAMVLKALSASGTLADWDVVRLEGMNQGQIADALGQCRLFLSFAEREGFGLPAAEAIASGCFVIGHTGIGGAEYWAPPTATIVPEDDVLGYISAASDWLEADLWNEETARIGSREILERYDGKSERSALIDLFTRALELAHEMPPPSPVTIRPSQISPGVQLTSLLRRGARGVLTRAASRVVK